VNGARVAFRVGLAVGALAMSCRRPTPAGADGTATGPSALASPEPPPLDTNWQHDPGHILSQGDRAPDFEGIAHTGMRVKLSRFSGKPVVVYFCSKDASPEGTAEARGYRDNWMRFNEKVGVVLGVTSDDRATHYDFATAERLPFLLVADEQGHIARAFGVGVEGRTSVAFIVGPDGKIARAFSEAPTEGQYGDVVKALESL
jgi:peroxiredoxin Q/BCP